MSSPSLAASRGWWVRLGRMDPRYPVSFLITLILVLGEARYGILGGYERLRRALGVLVAPRQRAGRVRGDRARAVTPAARLLRERAECLHHGHQPRAVDQAAGRSAL